MFAWLRRLFGRRDEAPGTPPHGTRRPTTPEEQRFASVYAEDRVGPMPYPNQASPDVAAARGRVRALVNDLLPNGVDEGTGAALDPLIASWASGWLARIDSEHADHHAVIDRLVGGARRQLADAEATHERDRRALEVARLDYADARERLREPAPRRDARAADPGPRRDTGADPEATVDATADPAGDPPTAPDPRRSAARGPRAARQALAVRGGREAEPVTGPLRVRDRAPDPHDDAVTEQETR